MGATKELWIYVAQNSGLVEIPLLGLISSRPNNSPGSTAPQKPKGRFGSWETDVLLEVLLQKFG